MTTPTLPPLPSCIWLVDKHVIALYRNWASGRAEITVDGERRYFRRSQWIDSGFEYGFDLDGQQVNVTVSTPPWLSLQLAFSYELTVDDKVVVP
jgi:hypothetical protein